MSAPPGTAPAIPRIAPVPGSHLEELLEMRDILIAQAKEAANRVKSANDAIKAESLAGQPEGTRAVDIDGSATRPALRVAWHPGAWTVDSQALKDGDPVTWARFAKQKKGYWGITALGGGR